MKQAEVKEVKPQGLNGLYDLYDKDDTLIKKGVKYKAVMKIIEKQIER